MYSLNTIFKLIFLKDIVNKWTSTVLKGFHVCLCLPWWVQDPKQFKG